MGWRRVAKGRLNRKAKLPIPSNYSQFLALPSMGFLLASSTSLYSRLRSGVSPKPAVPAIVIGNDVEKCLPKQRDFGIFMALSVRSRGVRLDAIDRAQVDEVSCFPQAADDPSNNAVGQRSCHGVPPQASPSVT